MDSTKALKRAGGKMANMLYNLAQRFADQPDLSDQMKAAQEEWDAALTALAEQGEAPQPAADGLEPTHWHCKDYADGWISFDSAGEALAYQRDTGCLLRVIYRPVPKSGSDQ